MAGRSKGCDPDEGMVPDMASYLQENILAGYHGWLSKTHLEDLIQADHPPGFYMKRTRVSRRKLVTKAMAGIGYPKWSETAWWIP